jgi:hypothetical protein
MTILSKVFRLLCVVVLCLAVVFLPQSAWAASGTVALTAPTRLAGYDTWTGQAVWSDGSAGSGQLSFSVTLTRTGSPSGSWYVERYVRCQAGLRQGQWYSATAMSWSTNSGLVFPSSVPSAECLGIADVAFRSIGIGVTPAIVGQWLGTLPPGSISGVVQGPPDLSAGDCRLTDAQLASVLVSAGWGADSAGRQAFARALAASRGRVNALSGSDAVGYSIGLWGINAKTYPQLDRARLGTDPLYAASSARSIVQSSGWIALPLTDGWQAFNGRAVAAMSNSVDPASGTGCKDVTGVAPGTDPSEDNCGWNPITWLKCAFLPKPESTDFTAQTDLAKSKAPIVYVVGAVSLMDNLTQPCDVKCPTFSELTVSVQPASGSQISPFTSAAPFLNTLGPGTAWHDVATTAGWVLMSAPIVMYVWRRLFPVIEE